MSSLRAIRPEACTFPARNIHSVFRRFRANTFAQSRSARDVRPMVVSPGNKRRWIAVPGCNTGQHTCRLVAFFGLRHFLVRSRLRFSLKRHNRQSPRYLPSLLRQNPRIPPHRHPSSTRSISTRQRQRNSIRSRKLAPPAPRPLSRPAPKANSRTGTISLPARSSRRTLKQPSRTWSASDRHAYVSNCTTVSAAPPQHLEPEAVEREALARLRDRARLVNDEARDGGCLGVGQVPVHGAVEVADRNRAVDVDGPVRQRPHARNLDIVLVADVAHDLFENVLQRDDAHELAVLIDHDGEWGAPSPKRLELLAERPGFRHEPRRA